MQTLSLNETRVLGSLLEKESTTPDQYPLSLNALTLACNQKSNREPVLNLSESEVQDSVDSLLKKGLVSEVVFGSRVKKYRQRFGNTEFSEFSFSKKELAMLCVLFLRGPQTPGELRTRTNRLCEFSDVTEVEHTLKELIERTGDNCVMQLAREPGKRESRYAHLFSGDDFSMYQSSTHQSSMHQSAIQSSHSNDLSPTTQTDHEERICALEEEVITLKEELKKLKQAWDEFNN